MTLSGPFRLRRMRGFNGGQLGFEGLGLSQRLALKSLPRPERTLCICNGLIPQHLCDRLHASSAPEICEHQKRTTLETTAKERIVSICW